MASHDCDLRYRDPEVKARVASLYLPLIGIVMDSLSQLYDPNTESLNRSAQRSKEAAEHHGIDQSIAMAIAGSLYGMPGNQSESSSDNSRVGKYTIL